MIKTLLLFILLALLALMAYAATRPAHFRVERKQLIQAPPEKIYPLIADFRRWVDWSPYEGLDPALLRTYNGPDSGVGAMYSWAGNNKVGKGRMEILSAQAPQALDIQLDFEAPMKARNTAEFRLVAVPGGPSTEVTWAMHGPANLLMRMIHIFFSMDKLVGVDFERGLARLKTKAEAP